MTFKAFRGQPFEYTHENQAFDKLNDLLQTEWAKKEESLYLFGNFFVGGKELDALIIKRNAIIVIDFKNYGGDVKFSENGRWVCNHVTVKGGNSINPFQQLRNNKFALLKYLEADSIKLLSKPNLGHIAGLVLFHQRITFDEQQIPAPIRSWFHISDLEHTIRTVNSIASPSIDLPQKDIDTLIKTFNISAYFPDGNKKTSKQKKQGKQKNSMSAYPYEPFGLNQSEQKVWKWIKEAFKDDDAVAYYRYPIFSRTGGSMKEPDIVMLHRDFGLWIFECKGISLYTTNKLS